MIFTGLRAGLGLAMGLTAFIAIILVFCGVVTGNTNLSGQWVSQDSVYNYQNVFQVQNGIRCDSCIESRDY